MVKSAKPRNIKTSFKFKSYTESFKQESKAKHRDHIALTVDSILQLVDDAKDIACDLQEFLSLQKTMNHIKVGNKLPRAAVRRIGALQTKLRSAFICFTEGVREDLKDEEVERTLKELAAIAEEIDQIADTLFIFAKQNIFSRVGLIQALLQNLIKVAQAARICLTPYTKSATIATVPTNINIVKNTSQALFGEDLELGSFLEKAPTRGFRVTERQLADQTSTTQTENDGLDDSLKLVWRLQKPIVNLLSDDTIVGVIQFPIITSNARRFPDALIQECSVPSLGYDFYLVFGDYLVIDKMCLLGIHRSIMKTFDDKNNPQLDVDKFVALHSYLISEQPEWAQVLQQTQPGQPAKREGSHYYCPLVPLAIKQKWSLGIGNWDFLTQ